MGKIKHIKNIRDFFKKNIVVDINSLKNFIRNRGGNKSYVYLLLNNMLKKGEINRITRGCYSLHEDPIISVFCFKPSYIGLQSALSAHNLWEQETIPTIISVKKVRQGIRKVNEDNVMIHRISPKYFFGIEYFKEGDFHVPISDVEKTLIDMIYFNQPLSDSLMKSFKDKLDKKKLDKYLKKYSKRFRGMVKDALNEIE